VSARAAKRPRLRNSTRTALIALDAVMAANAVAGGWYAVSGAPDVPTKWLDGTPFDDYVIPGLALSVLVGGTQAAAALSLLRDDPRAREVSMAASGVLLAWIAAQVAMIGYVSPLQPIVATWAVGTLALAKHGLAGER
jgi:hypothetical protein